MSEDQIFFCNRCGKEITRNPGKATYYCDECALLVKAINEGKRMRMQPEKAIGVALCHFCGTDLEGKICADLRDVLVCPKCISVVNAIIGTPWDKKPEVGQSRTLFEEKVNAYFKEKEERMKALEELKESGMPEVPSDLGGETAERYLEVSERLKEAMFKSDLPMQEIAKDASWYADMVKGVIDEDEEPIDVTDKEIEGATEYMPIGNRLAKRMGCRFRVTHPDGNRQTGEFGDYLVQNVEGNLYIVGAEEFNKIYSKVIH